MSIISQKLEELSRVISSGTDGACEIFYRGLERHDYQDQPTLFRNSCLSREREVFQEVMRTFPTEFENAKAIDVLVKLQHYCAPTRLLDVTSSFLVALFFACGGWNKTRNATVFDEQLKCDGAVRIYFVPKDDIKSINSETVTLLSNIAKLKQVDRFEQLFWQCRKEVPSWHDEDEDLRQYAKEDANKVFLVKTKLNNPRVRAQQGSFFLFGGLWGVESEDITKYELPFPYTIRYRDILIAKDEKETLLQELDTYCNLRFSTLCPEMADYISVVDQEIQH